MKPPVKPKGPPPKAIGICWFKRASFAEDRAAMIDPDELFDTFDEWQKSALQLEAKVRAQGVHTVRVPFDAASFKAFYEQHAGAPNAAARAAWAGWRAQVMFQEWLAAEDEAAKADTPKGKA